MRRLRKSASMLSLPIPLTDAEIGARFDETITRPDWDRTVAKPTFAC
jgi:branched-subunit amino acid aminotransferase/4-amino-4-deoxychorismate lyase